jgi:hypothetical protein
LLGLVGPDDLAALEEIEGATSSRLIAQSQGTATLGPRDLIFGVPHAAFINAAFAYAKPRGLNRFNGPDRGAWYASYAVETSLAEISFHMTAMLADTGVFEATVDYAELFAYFAGAFVDLRAHPEHPSLHPDPDLGYPAGNALATQVRATGLNGMIYPSVRHAGGTCLVALFPHAVQSVAQGDLYRLVWRGSPAPTVQIL